MSTECSSGAVPGGVLANLPSLPAKPSEAGSPGRGGARERAQFSPPGGNGDKRTLRRRAAVGKVTRRPQAAKFPWFRKKEATPRRNSTSQMSSPLRQPRGETKFRTKFFCLLFFSRKVGQLKRFMARSAPSFRMHSTASAARFTASSMTFLSSPWNLPSTQSARS